MNPLQDQAASNVFIEGELSEEDLIKIAGGISETVTIDGLGVYTREEAKAFGFIKG